MSWMMIAGFSCSVHICALKFGEKVQFWKVARFAQSIELKNFEFFLNGELWSVISATHCIIVPNYLCCFSFPPF